MALLRLFLFSSLLTVCLASSKGPVIDDPVIVNLVETVNLMELKIETMDRELRKQKDINQKLENELAAQNAKIERSRFSTE